jgi:hypothetical protein
MAMNVRYTDRPKVTGSSNQFNQGGHGEVIVGFDTGDMDSVPISELEIMVPGGEWVDLRQAFRDKIVMGDNYDHYFAFAGEEDQARGWIK